MQVGTLLEFLISKHLYLLGLRGKLDQVTRFFVCCAVLHFFGLNLGTHISLCQKIRLSGPRRTTSVLRLDLSTEIDPI